MEGFDIAEKRLSKEEELSNVEENILEEHTIFSFCFHLKAVEDAIEGNDNNFDGVINNLPEPDPAEALRQQARQSDQAAARDSVLEELILDGIRSVTAYARDHEETAVLVRERMNALRYQICSSGETRNLAAETARLSVRELLEERRYARSLP